MALLTAFNELNHEFELVGLEGVVNSHDGLNVTEHDLFRFQDLVHLELSPRLCR